MIVSTESLPSTACIRIPTDPNASWFKQACFGMFIHFGIYSQMGRGDWCMLRENIPRDEYVKLADSFNPHLFDAHQWIDIAEDAGAKYMIVTTKHHDGFCLFDSSLTDYKITNTPFKRDLIGELVAACQERGMRIVLYYSQPDWHHRNYVHRPNAFKDLDPAPADQIPDWDRFLEYYMGQVEELCTKYGPIDGIWFDGSHRSEKEWQGRQVYNLIKSYQPHAVVNCRGGYGDFYTPEREMPDDLHEFLFEVCDSLQIKSWGYHSDTPLHDSQYLINWLTRVRGRGGNYVVNVGPKPDGSIDLRQRDLMAGIGKWIRQHSEAVYAKDPFLLSEAMVKKGFSATRAGQTVYLMVTQWPSSNASEDQTLTIKVDGFDTTPLEVALQGYQGPVSCRLQNNVLELSQLPFQPPNPLGNVFRLKFRTGPSPLQISKPVVQAIPVTSKNKTLLSPDQAIPVGRGVKGNRVRLHFDEHENRPILTRWNNEKMSVQWQLHCEQPGIYQCRIQVRCDPQYAGSTYQVHIEESDFYCEGVIAPTSEKTFQWQLTGNIELKQGVQTLTLKPVHMPMSYVFADVAGLELQPVVI